MRRAIRHILVFGVLGVLASYLVAWGFNVAGASFTRRLYGILHDPPEILLAQSGYSWSRMHQQWRRDVVWIHTIRSEQTTLHPAGGWPAWIPRDRRELAGAEGCYVVE